MPSVAERQGRTLQNRLEHPHHVATRNEELAIRHRATILITAVSE